MQRITIKRARTWHCRRMRHYVELSNGLAPSSQFRSWLDCIINTSGCNFRKGQASLNLPKASHALEMMQEAFAAYRAVVADLSDAEKSKAWNEVYTCLKQFEDVRGFAAQFEFVIGVGAKASK